MTHTELTALIRELLAKLGILGEVTIHESERHTLVSIETDESALLIGRGGETLDALQTIIRLIAYQKNLDQAPIVVDVNNYRIQREEELIWFVRETANRVTESGQSETLRPMSSYERRLVHQIVDEMEGLVSESTGEGAERRISIRKE